MMDRTPPYDIEIPEMVRWMRRFDRKLDAIDEKIDEKLVSVDVYEANRRADHAAHDDIRDDVGELKAASTWNRRALLANFLLPLIATVTAGLVLTTGGLI